MPEPDNSDKWPYGTATPLEEHLWPPGIKSLFKHPADESWVEACRKPLELLKEPKGMNCQPKHSPEPWLPCIDEIYSGEDRILGPGEDFNRLGGERLRCDIERASACVNACKGIPTDWLTKYGRTAFVRRIYLVPKGQVGGVHEALKGPLEVSEDVVHIDTCEHCGGITPVTKADTTPPA